MPTNPVPATINLLDMEYSCLQHITCKGGSREVICDGCLATIQGIQVQVIDQHSNEYSHISLSSLHHPMTPLGGLTVALCEYGLTIAVGALALKALRTAP